MKLTEKSGRNKNQNQLSTRNLSISDLILIKIIIIKLSCNIFFAYKYTCVQMLLNAAISDEKIERYNKTFS